MLLESLWITRVVIFLQMCAGETLSIEVTLFSPSNTSIIILLPRWPLGAQPNRGEPPPIAQEIEMVVIDLNTLQILPKTFTGHKGFTDSTVGQNITWIAIIL